MRPFVFLFSALFLQLIVASYMPAIFFIPPVAVYIATFVSFPYAALLALVTGIFLDGISPFPFGTYLVSVGGSMIAARWMLRMVDERQLGAHGIVAGGMLLGVALFEAGFFLAMGYEFMVVFDVLYDLILWEGVLAGVVTGHMIYNRL